MPGPVEFEFLLRVKHGRCCWLDGGFGAKPARAMAAVVKDVGPWGKKVVLAHHDKEYHQKQQRGTLKCSIILTSVFPTMNQSD
jgi:hypothetical protein